MKLEELLFFKKHYDIHKPIKEKGTLVHYKPFKITIDKDRWSYPLVESEDSLKWTDGATLRWGDYLYKYNIEYEDFDPNNINVFNLLFPDIVINNIESYLIKLTKEIYDIREDNENDLYYIILFGTDTTDKLYVGNTLINEEELNINYDKDDLTTYLYTSKLIKDYVENKIVSADFPKIRTYTFNNIKAILMMKENCEESKGIHINNQYTYAGFMTRKVDKISFEETCRLRRSMNIIDTFMDFKVRIEPLHNQTLLFSKCWLVVPI